MLTYMFSVRLITRLTLCVCMTCGWNPLGICLSNVVVTGMASTIQLIRIRFYSNVTFIMPEYSFSVSATIVEMMFFVTTYGACWLVVMCA